MPTIDLDEGLIAYADTGSGTGVTLVLLHGMFLDARTWATVLPALSAGRRVIAFDQPGHGDSTPVARRMYDWAWLADRYRRALDRLGVDRYVVVGHSMGGGTALWLGQADPRVAGVIHVAGVGLDSPLPPLLRWLARGLPDAWFTALVHRPSTFEKFLALHRTVLYRRVELIDEGLLRERFDRMSRPDHLSALEAYYRQLADARTLAAIVAKVKVPALIVSSTDDPVFRKSPVHERLANALPSARLMKITHCGHTVQEEAPMELSHAMLAFLAPLDRC